MGNIFNKIFDNDINNKILLKNEDSEESLGRTLFNAFFLDDENVEDEK